MDSQHASLGENVIVIKRNDESDWKHALDVIREFFKDIFNFSGPEPLYRGHAKPVHHAGPDRDPSDKSDDATPPPPPIHIVMEEAVPRWWLFQRRNALVVIYGVTAVVGVVGFLAVRSSPSLRAALGWALGALVTYVVGHFVFSGGSLKAAEERTSEVWEETEFPDVKLPDRVKRMLLTKDFRDAEHAYANERVVVAFHEHPIHLVKWWAGAVLVLLVSYDFAARTGNWRLTLVLWLVLALVMAIKIGNWRRAMWLITNRRVIHVIGLIGMKSPTMPITRVTDVAAVIPPWSKALAFLRIIYLPVGYIPLESPGQEQQIYKIPHIPDANGVNRSLQEWAVRAPLE